jgi:hypothetical protein
MLRVFCSALSPLLLDLVLLEPPPVEDPPEEELPEEDDFEEEEGEEPLPPAPELPPLDSEPPPFLAPVLEEEPTVGVVTAGGTPVLVPGAAALGGATEITCAGTVEVFPAPARPIRTPGDRCGCEAAQKLTACLHLAPPALQAVALIVGKRGAAVPAGFHRAASYGFDPAANGDDSVNTQPTCALA